MKKTTAPESQDTLKPASSRATVVVPKVLRTEDLTILIDTREQYPFDVKPFKFEETTLETGDYTLKGLEDHVTVERKSLPDFVACCGRERERFYRELRRLRGFPHSCIVIEATYRDVVYGEWKSRVTSNAVLSSIASWTAHYCPVVLAGNWGHAGDFTKRFLWTVAKRRWEELKDLT